MNAAVEQLSKTPWCKALIEDPAWRPASNRSHVKKALAQDSFWGGTLGTDKTVRHYLTLKPSEELDEDIAYREVWSLLDIGTGVNGHPGICHGGFVATMLDETLGAFVMSNLVQKERRRRRMGLGPKEKISCFTACEYSTLKRNGGTRLMIARSEYTLQETCPRARYSLIKGEIREAREEQVVCEWYNRGWKWYGVFVRRRNVY